MNILIIDDSEDDRLLYRRALQKGMNTSYGLAEADDGDAGLRLIREQEPVCILLDYSLPGHNGLEVLKRIRTKYPFIPVVMLTGQGNEEVAVTAMQEGAQNYIAKSNITPESLQRVIRVAIEHCALQKRIHEQRASLEVFTRALAHDLKEPVRTIRSFVEMITQQEMFSGKTAGYFQHIRSAADRMHMLIDTVFLYTRLDDPGLMARGNSDMAGILEEVKENLHHLIWQRSAVITCESLPEVYANRTQMIQLMQNLCCNAIQHSRNPVTLQISAAVQGDHWLFRISDNGPGIGEDYFEKIFEPFKRLTHYEEQGAGLGLAICKKIVESHGGKIWCESQPGAGATFLFTLPTILAVTDDARCHPAEASAPAVLPADARRPLANLLVVDDSKADIEVTRFRLIERVGLQCNLFVARDGEEALAMLHRATQENTPIDLMLLDINMPEMDGFELLERMRRDDALQKVAVVMCTGSIYDKDMERAQALGAAGYLTKPIEFTKLQSVIDHTATVQLCQKNEGYALLRVA